MGEVAECVRADPLEALTHGSAAKFAKPAGKMRASHGAEIRSESLCCGGISMNQILFDRFGVSRTFRLLGKVGGVAVLLSLGASGCGQDDVDIQEVGQQVGDVMASIDESGGSAGSLAYSEIGYRATFARLAPGELRDSWLSELWAPNAYATGCSSGGTWSACASNVITRTFGGCTIGGASLSGTVKLTFTDAVVDSTCSLAANGHSVARVPEFTLTGRRGATLKVEKTGTVGQVVTRTASGFSFTNDGIRRVFTGADGSPLFDFTTTTTEAITVSGQSRANRILNGGVLRVTNNANNTTCDFVPSDVRWNINCNCANQGTWTATCSDGKQATLSITGCGKGRVKLDEEEEDFEFDRCYGI
jgi:hypothetical protein